MLTQQDKDSIAEAARRYIKSKEISQSAFASLVEVDRATISHILNGKYEIQAGKGKSASISDSKFLSIRRFLDGGKLIIRTSNYKDINGTLAFCKRFHKYRIIDGQTGAGKTFACEQFKRNNPIGTYLIRCSGDLTAKELMEAMGTATGVGTEGTRASIRVRVVEKLKRMEEPIIIFDEAENLKDSLYAMIKAVADDLKDIAGIVLIGANNSGHGYFEWMRRSAERKRGCFPQVFSRFKSHPTVLGSIGQGDIEEVCRHYGFDAQTRISLQESCKDMRDLIETASELEFRNSLQTH